MSPFAATGTLEAPATLRVGRFARPTAEPATRPSLDVVVITHQSAEDLGRCFDAIETAAAVAGAGIIVVDNGSSDGSLDAVPSSGTVPVIRVQQENLGYASAVNTGAALSSAEYLIVLNPDVRPAPDAFAELVDHMVAHPAAGAVAPRLLNEDGTTQSSVRPVPNLAMMLGRQTPLGRTSWGRRHAERYVQTPKVGKGRHAQCEWAIGAAVCVRRRDFDLVGGWDDGFFLYFEDVDFCKRLREAGRQVHWLPNVTCVHEYHRSSSRENGSALRSLHRRAHLKSAARFFRKHPDALVRRTTPLDERRVAMAARRALDVSVAGAALLLLAPLLALIALAVRRDSPGPILFRQTRLGRDGEAFTLFKFRTMRHECDHEPHARFVEKMIKMGHAAIGEDGRPVYKIFPDDRVTRVGRRLRAWSLDELPQLLNVLKGDMSLVGFRPPIPYELEHYPDWYFERFDGRPGLTGLWQVSGRNERSYEEMVLLDIEHQLRRSLWFDLKLLLRTPLVLLRRRGAV